MKPDKILDAGFRLATIGLFAIVVKNLIDRAEEQVGGTILDRVKSKDPQLIGEAILWLIALGVVASVGHNIWDREDTLRIGGKVL